MAEEYTKRVIRIISSIPRGRVLTYGGVAALAGNPRGARQVSRILHSMSRKHHLPWHRVVNSKGRISLPHPSDYEAQRRLLELEDVRFSLGERIDFDTYIWKPAKEENSSHDE